MNDPSLKLGHNVLCTGGKKKEKGKKYRTKEEEEKRVFQVLKKITNFYQERRGRKGGRNSHKVLTHKING